MFPEAIHLNEYKQLAMTKDIVTIKIQMIDEDIRFFRQHFPNVTLHPNFKRVATEGAGIPGLSQPVATLGSQIESRMIGLQSGFAGRDFSSVSGADIRSGLQKIRATQMQVLEQLRQQHQQIRKISVAASGRTSRVSEHSSSVPDSQQSSVIRQQSRASNRQQSSTLVKKLESELSMKVRRVTQLQSTVNELQNTVQQLRVELKRKEELNEANPSKIKEIQTQLAGKFEKEITYYKSQTQRFIAENTKLKKELVGKVFEIEELKRNLQHSKDQLRFYEDQTRRKIKSMEETMASKQLHYKRLITQSEEKPIVLTTSSTPYRDYETFKRDELTRIQKSSRWGRLEYGDDEASLFRKLLDEEITRARDRYSELEKNYKTKVGELETFEKQLRSMRQREEQLLQQITRTEQNIRRQAEQEAFTKYSEKEEILNRRIMEKEDIWSRKLQQSQENWTRALSQALEKQKKSNFDQFYRTLEQQSRHKENQVRDLRSDRQTHQKRYSKLQHEYHESTRKLNAEIDRLGTELSKQRRKNHQLSETPQSSKRDLQTIEELRRNNQHLQKSLDQLKRYTEQQQYNSKANSQDVDRMREQSNRLQGEIIRLQTEISRLNSKITQNSQYIDELERALKPLSPKRPSIMQQTDFQNWKARQQQYLQKIQSLQRQVLQNSRGSAQQSEWQRKQESYQQTITQLRNRLQSNIRRPQANGHLEVEQLKQFIKDAVQNPASVLRQRNLQLQRELERVHVEKNQNEQSLRAQFRLENEQLHHKIHHLQSEKNNYFNLHANVKLQHDHLHEKINRLTGELARRDQMRLQQKALMSTEIARLTSECDIFRRKYQIQIPKIARINEQMMRSLNEKYERDVNSLKIINQRLMQQTAEMLQIHNQNQQLAVANRHLQAQVKQKSQAVEHLWSVKQAEYENISLQIRRIKAIQII